MFTGIIEEIGTISRITTAGNSMRLEITTKKITQGLQVGDSVAVNGVCLTVTTFNSQRFCADVMPVTFRDTNLAQLKSGSPVNLERAMAANGRFGGHLVSGHVDGIGVINAIKANENAVIYRISLSANLLADCMLKGSLAIDGTSLTISAMGADYVEVSLIPHTRQESILGAKKIGATVNIECDMLLKKVSQQISRHNDSRIDMNFLRENGFL